MGKKNGGRTGRRRRKLSLEKNNKRNKMGKDGSK